MKKIVTWRLLLVVLLSMCSMFMETAQAVEFKGVVGIGYDVGGDILITAPLSDGTTADIKANEGFQLNLGVVMVTGSFETQTTMGYKTGGKRLSNGSIVWDATPLEFMEFYRMSNVRMGLGLTYQINPKLVVDALPGDPLNGTYNFDNSSGTVAQIGWAPAKSSFSIDLRYTANKYKKSNLANAKEISGNVIGLYTNFFF